MAMHPGVKPRAEIIIGEEKYTLDDIFISELGYLMVRIYSLEKRVYTTYNLGSHDPEENFIKDAIEKEKGGRDSSN
jgi:hypothetical protein